MPVQKVLDGCFGLDNGSGFDLSLVVYKRIISDGMYYTPE